MTAGIFLLALALVAEPPAAIESAKRAYAAAQAGRWEEAATALREAARLAPANPLYRTGLGGILEKQGRREEAVAEFTAALRLDPANRQLRDRVGALALDTGAELARAGRFRAGLKLAREHAALFPDSPAAFQMLGLFLLRTHENPASAEAYQRALQLDPDSADASVGLGIAQSEAGLTAEAARTFTAGLQRFPRDAMHRQAYGVLLVKLAETGDGEAARQARPMLLSALALNESLAESHYQLGLLELAAGDAPGALASLERAARHGLDDSRRHYATARALRRLGRQAEAEAALASFRRRKAAEEAAPR
ncbi:MAG: tetratricopeptide repeat protein [Acidobacteriota bacterium]|jgi:tetratricopeptide (TPR) repeat protein